MTATPKDALLRFGQVLALILQAICAVAGIIAVLIIPIVLLASQDMLPGSLSLNGIAMVEASPSAVVGILLSMAVSLGALFLFFGKMRAIIGSARDGDPFIPDNARRLNAMAWLVLIHEVAAVVVGELRFHVVNLVDQQGGDTIDYSLYDLDGLLVALVLFILARVFRHGTAMREDLEGTV